MSPASRFLILEDTESDTELLVETLRAAGIVFDWVWVETAEDYRSQLESFRPDVVLSDYTLPQFNALDALRLLKESGHDAMFILVTGSQSEEVAVACMKEGAVDYILKHNLTRLPAAVVSALERRSEVARRKRAEGEARRLAIALEQTFDSIVITDTAGTIQYVNPAFERITGYTRDEAIGRNPRLLKSGKVAPEVYRDLWATITRGEVWEGYLTNTKKDGSLYEEHVTVSPVRDGGGEVVSYIAVKQDMTTQLHLEEQLRQSQKMEAVGRLAGGVAHDFNNLLTVINGYCELTLREMLNGSPLRHNIEGIKKAGERAAALTRQLLAFSRKQVLQPRVVNLNTVISELEKMLRRLIGEDIELHTQLKDDLGSVRADPGQLEQVIVNLAVNARDAMPQGGKLTIETRNAELGQEYAAKHAVVIPGSYVMIAVSDTGTGMETKTKQHLFEPFFTTKEQGKGTGLGLSTVYGIIKQSGGYVWVYSEVGQGTTFKIYLPRVEETAEPYRRPLLNAATVPGGRETILLVEDEEIVKRLTRDLLASYGYKILEAANGIVAQTLAESYEGEIDLLLTDVIMPGISGRELAERLLSRRPALHVLYMSGYTSNAIVHHGVLDEGINLIEKPFSPDALARKVREVLDEGSGDGRAKA